MYSCNICPIERVFSHGGYLCAWDQKSFRQYPLPTALSKGERAKEKKKEGKG